MEHARGAWVLFVCFVFGEVTLSNTFSMANKHPHRVSLPSTVGFESNQTKNVFKRSAILAPRPGKLQGHEPTGPMATTLVDSMTSLLDSQSIATVNPSGSKIAIKIPDKHVATKTVKKGPKKTTTVETTVETEETTTEETTVATEETSTEETTVETEETSTEETTVETEETEMTTEETTVKTTTVQPTTVRTKRDMSAVTSSPVGVKETSPRSKKYLSKTLVKEPKKDPLLKKSDETSSHPMNVVDHSQQKSTAFHNTTQEGSTAHNWKTPSENNSDKTSSHPMNVVDHSQLKRTAIHNTTQEGSTAYNWTTPSENTSDKTSSHTMNVVDHPQQRDSAFHNTTQEGPTTDNCTTPSENISVDVKIKIELSRSNSSAAVINSTEDYFTTDMTPRHQKKRKVAGVILVVLISLSAACAILFVLMPSKHEHRPRDRVELLSARNRPRFYDTSLHMGH